MKGPSACRPRTVAQSAPCAARAAPTLAATVSSVSSGAVSAVGSQAVVPSRARQRPSWLRAAGGALMTSIPKAPLTCRSMKPGRMKSVAVAAPGAICSIELPNAIVPALSEPSGRAISPASLRIPSRPQLVGLKAFRQQAREAGQVHQVEDFPLAGEHCHRRGLERLDVLPGLLQSERGILGDERRGQLYQDPQAANHPRLIGDL